MNEEEVKKLIDEHIEIYEPFCANCDTEDTFYNLLFDMGVIEGAPTPYHRCSTGRLAVDNASAQIDTSSFQVYVPPSQGGPTYQENAILHEKFYRGSWRAVFEDDPILLFKTLKPANLYGVSWWKFIYKDIPEEKGESAEAYAERLKKWRVDNNQMFPFEIRLCHPTTIKPDPSDKPRNFVEVRKMRVRDVKADYPDIKNLDYGSDKFCVWKEYWSPTEYCYMCNDEVVTGLTENKFKFMPYDEIDAGFGYRDKDGSPDKWWRGLLNPVHDALITESQVMFEFEIGLRNNIFPEKILKGTNESAGLKEVAEVAATWEKGPAANNALPYNIDLKDPRPVVFPPQIGELVGAKKAEIDAIMPRVAIGDSPEGPASGYKVAILAGMARIRWGPVKLSLQRAMAGVNQKLARCVETFPEFENGISVWGRIGAEAFDVEVKPKDIKGYYVNEVSLSSVAPEEESRLLHDGLACLQAGAISKYLWATKFAKIEDPEADRIQRLRESYEESPEVQAWMVQELLKSRTPQILGPTGQPLPPSGPPNMGNAGNPPPPFMSGQTENPYRPPMAGSPEEQNLVARQAARAYQTNPLQPKGTVV